MVIPALANASWLVITCHHCLRSTQNIVVEGVIIAGNGYTDPLVAPDLPLNHPAANSYNSKGYANKNDPDFNQTCHVATIEVTVAFQEHQLNLLDKVLVPEPSCLKKYPFKKLIIQAIPIKKKCADTEKSFGTSD